MKKLAFIALAMSLVTGAAHGTAYAHGWHHFGFHRYYRYHHRHHLRWHPVRDLFRHEGYSDGGSNVAAARRQGLPWCGAFMADLYHFAGAVGRELWLAANWAHVGHPTVPHVGAVVVWRHHVGKIVGQDGRGWVVLSGNDGHTVRQRLRSLAGAIAVREI